MTRFLLDTGIAGDYVNRRRGVYQVARRKVLDGHRIGVGYPTLAELHYGVEYSTSVERNRVTLDRALCDLIRWPLTVDATRTYGELAANLRRRGRKIQTMDLLIAAIALNLNDCVVVSADSDLFAVPNLRLENWTESGS